MTLLNPLSLFVLIIFIIILFCVLYIKPIYAFPFYFVLLYFEGIFLQGSRQRVLFSFQIAYFIVYFIIFLLRNKRKPIYIGRWVGKSLIICLISQAVFSIMGYINGYNISNILINNYKFVEVFLFYFVISTSADNTSDMQELLHILTIFGMLLGAIELITTIRGGVGLLIVMNFGGIIFSEKIINKRKNWKQIAILSTIIVVFSQARSYMIAYFLALAVVYIFCPPDVKRKTIRFIIPFAVVFVIAIILFSENDRVSMLLARLAGLGEGLDKAGGYRWAEFQVAFSKFLEEPFGRGLGFLEYTYIRGMGFFEWGDYMHIATGEIMLKTGIIGTLLYYYLTLKTANLGYSRIKYARENNNTLYAVCVGGFAGIVSRIIFYNMSSHNTYGHLFLPMIFADIYYDLYMREK